MVDLLDLPMKRNLIKAVIATCIGTIIVQFGLPSNYRSVDSPPIPTYYDVQAPQEPLQANVDTQPLEPAKEIVEPPKQPEAPVYAPMSENDAKNFIYSHESSMRLDAMNSIGACGLGQALPCSKMSSVCPNWRTDYACQDAWFTNYMIARYGTWESARIFWLNHNWW